MHLWGDRYALLVTVLSRRKQYMTIHLLFYVLFKNFSLMWRRHHYRVRAAKFRPRSALRAFEQGGIFVVPHLLGLGFSGLVRRTAQFSRLLRHTRGCWGSILTRVLTYPHSVPRGCWGPILTWVPTGCINVFYTNDWMIDYYLFYVPLKNISLI
jgi:hypothetical protein